MPWNSNWLKDILKTPEGLKAITGLLASLYYAPIGSGFIIVDYDPYTTKLRAFVQQVLIRNSGKPSRRTQRFTYLDGLKEDSGNDLKEILYMAEHLEAELNEYEGHFGTRLKDLCDHLLHDPGSKRSLDRRMIAAQKLVTPRRAAETGAKAYPQSA